MVYTVKQIAVMSGVSIRTLHFYHEVGLLKPARLGENGYRLYEEPQLLTLQQILFYRELGFELKQIKQILGRADFQKLEALQSHRKVLQKKLARTRQLIDTIDKTIQHLKGAKKMKGKQMFTGFSVAAGRDRFDEQIKLGGEPNDCKVSAQDTDGALCIFEFTGGGGGPRHLHPHQDEWIYVIDGDLDVRLGDKQFLLGNGESIFLPRKVAHTWGCVNRKSAKIINVYQPAGRMEEFFREVGRFVEPPIHEALTVKELHQLFDVHGMDLLGPPLGWDEYLAAMAAKD